MVRKTNLAAIALALAAGTVMTGTAEARISFNRISFNRIAFNRISFNGIAANGGARVDRVTTTHTKRVSAHKTAGEGSVGSVLSVELPTK